MIKYTVEVSLPMEGRKENIVNLVTSQITEGELEGKPVRLLSLRLCGQKMGVLS